MNAFFYIFLDYTQCHFMNHVQVDPRETSKGCQPSDLLTNIASNTFMHLFVIFMHLC